MRRGLEIAVFVLLAGAIHLLAFAQRPLSGVRAGGSGGAAVVSIEAAAQTVVDMVQSWERPPEVTQVTQQNLTAPSAPPDIPAAPQIELPQAPRAALKLALAQPQEADALNLETTPPPPPPEPKAKTEPRPEPKQQEKQPEQGQKAQQTSAARNKEVAAGTGGAAHAGQGSDNVSVGDAGQKAELLSVWGARIRSRIERNKRYPRGTNSNGDIKIELTVARDGRLLGYRMRNSSGYAELDQAAMDAVARAKRFPKAPKALTGNSFSFSVVIRMGPSG